MKWETARQGWEIEGKAMNTEMVAITGYEQDGWCEHCGRKLRHCIRISDGRIVGATCFDKKITKPKVYQGKPYRVGSQHIIHTAKVVQFRSADKWSRYGVSANTIQFEVA